MSSIDLHLKGVSIHTGIRSIEYQKAEKGQQSEEQPPSKQIKEVSTTYELHLDGANPKHVRIPSKAAERKNSRNSFVQILQHYLETGQKGLYVFERDLGLVTVINPVLETVAPYA